MLKGKNIVLKYSKAEPFIHIASANFEDAEGKKYTYEAQYAESVVFAQTNQGLEVLMCSLRDNHFFLIHRSKICMLVGCEPEQWASYCFYSRPEMRRNALDSIDYYKRQAILNVK